MIIDLAANIKAPPSHQHCIVVEGRTRHADRNPNRQYQWLFGTISEHGLSFWIEHNGHAVLFDVGKTGAFLHNAGKLGINPAQAEAVVISHGHYDHGGGFRDFCETCAYSGSLWTGNMFFDQKWSDDAKGLRYLGLDFDSNYLDQRHITWQPVTVNPGATTKLEIVPGVFLISGFPRHHAEEQISPRFVVDRPELGRIKDDFSDEVCIAIELPTGIAVVLGCAHPGLMNMLDAVQALFQKPLAAVFGGSHLVEADNNRLVASINYLKDSACPLVALGHCTGETASIALANCLERYRPMSVGAEFVL